MDAFFPVDLAEALAVKAARPDAVPVAGGTDLMVDLNFGRRHPPAVVDVSRLPELLAWHADGSHLFVGAGVTYSRILSGELPSTPPLAAASRTIGSRQIRNRGTVGGNLGTASPAGDALPVLAALDAEVVLAGAEGGPRAERRVPLDAFLVGPKQTSLQPHELILGTRVKLVRGPGVFSKIGARNAMVIAVASVCLVLDEDARRVRLAAGSVGPTVTRLRRVEAVLEEVLASAGAWDDPSAVVDPAGVHDAARLMEVSVRPIDDARGTAAYRRHACGVLVRRALRWALDERMGAMQVPA